MPGFCPRMARLNFSRLSALLGSVILQLFWKLFSWRFLLLIASVSAHVARYPAVENSLFLKDAMNYFTLAYILIPSITEILNISCSSKLY